VVRSLISLVITFVIFRTNFSLLFKVYYATICRLFFLLLKTGITPANQCNSKFTNNNLSSLLNQKLLKLLIFFSCFSLLLGELVNWDEKLLTSLPSWFIAFRVKNFAQNITFKVHDNEEFLGSGTLMYRRDNQYFVLTNKHVLRSGKPPYQIKTPDGKFHEVLALDLNTFPQDDLILLSFQSDRAKYKPPEFTESSQLQIDEAVFAVGFPLEKFQKETPQPNLPTLTITKGQITNILNKPLLEGYQIAYSNDVQKGMSGGALFNKAGKVVGINGKQAYPLWDIPDLYQDKSPVDKSLQSLINSSSLAIPITKALNFAAPTN